MPLVVKDRVKETTLTTGTGTLTLAGAVQGFQSFAVIGNANTTYYTIVDAASGDWEVGVGTYTASGTTLSRDTVLESSNANSLVNFGAGAKDVFVTYPADFAVFSNDVGVVDIQEFTTPGTSTWTKPAGARILHVIACAGGGGGGSGRRRGAANLSTAAWGGGGGGPGGLVEFWIAADLVGSTATVTVGAGGAGGAARTADNSNGLAGGAGTNSSFNGSFFARGGAGGAGGTTAGGNGGSPGPLVLTQTLLANGSTTQYTAVGGVGSASTGGAGNANGLGPGAGGGGAGQQASNSTASAGGNGGLGGALLSSNVAVNGNGGAGGSTSGTDGSAGPDAVTYSVGGSGGGGGGSNATTTFVAGSGGAGGFPGGGGGGGAAAGGSYNSGAGGNGGGGYVRVTTYF